MVVVAVAPELPHVGGRWLCVRMTGSQARLPLQILCFFPFLSDQVNMGTLWKVSTNSALGCKFVT